jgi:hypothetical protein
MRTASAVITMVLLMPLPAKGHPHTNTILGGPLTSKAIQEWDLAVRLEGALTPALISQYNRHIRPPRIQIAHSHTPRRTWTGTVEQWRPLVEKYFRPDDVPWAMRVMACESGGNPYAKNPTSSASGLFQHLARLWDGRSSAAGWGGADIFDGEANIAVAAWLVYEGGGKGHWNASRHCWG